MVKINEYNGYSSIELNLKRETDDSYKIIIDWGIFREAAQTLSKTKRYAIVTDSNVKILYADSLGDILRDEGLECSLFHFPAGEKNKTIDTCVAITDQMTEQKFGRDTVILAIGGGVVGDVAGFIATIYNRGVPYIQIPTTLLAQADASVGGKTGVDTKYAKNVLGAFKQPSSVWIDIYTLSTLDDTQIRNGLAETIKHAIIKDRDFFEFLEGHSVYPMVHTKNNDVLRHITKSNCIIKGNVVEQDPNEKGLRRILNYGHTAGHTIEHLMNQQLPENEIFPHGYGVSIGMMVAGRIALALGTGFSKRDLQRQERLLERTGLPIKIPSEISNEDIIRLTAVDKKAAGAKARYCLPSGIGGMCDFSGVYATNVDEKIVIEALNASR